MIPKLVQRDAARALDLGRRIDDRTLTWLADTPHGRITPVLRGVAHTADLLLPWAGITTWWLHEGRAHLRRGAIRGATAIAVSALVENGVLKPLVGRTRPASDRLPKRQRHRDRPSTSAFPSGHAGAATAFAVAASTEAPAWRPLLGITAVVTTYSLVYTGRHYATDAIAGVVIGAAAGACVRQIPPHGADRRGARSPSALPLPARSTPQPFGPAPRRKGEW